MIRSIRLSPPWMASSRSTTEQPHKRPNGRRNFQFRSFARVWRKAELSALQTLAIGAANGSKERKLLDAVELHERPHKMVRRGFNPALPRGRFCEMR